MAGSYEDDEYRKQAGNAQLMADRAKSSYDRESWLRIAQGWMSLIRKPRGTVSERFDEQAQDQGIGQEDSEGSH